MIEVERLHYNTHQIRYLRKKISPASISHGTIQPVHFEGKTMDQASTTSKPLGHKDDSATEFVIEMLQGDPTFGINFDRVQWDSKHNCYVIVEYLLCDESQFPKGITPFTSHPNRYFNKNAKKFISLWQITKDLNAQLYLVNYSKKGTLFEDQVLVMRVDEINQSQSSPVKTTDRKFTRQEFSAWFRGLNKRGIR